jgi:hypothetical protein
MGNFVVKFTYILDGRTDIWATHAQRPVTGAPVSLTTSGLCRTNPGMV